MTRLVDWNIKKLKFFESEYKIANPNSIDFHFIKESSQFNLQIETV